MKTLRTLTTATCLALVASSCATGYATKGQARGFLRLEVEPGDVMVEIDEQYSGVANGWADSVIPVRAGMRKLTLSADGYITQRFDLEVGPNEEVTLILKLEPTLELAEDTSPAANPRFKPSLGAVR